MHMCGHAHSYSCMINIASYIYTVIVGSVAYICQCHMPQIFSSYALHNRHISDGAFFINLCFDNSGGNNLVLDSQYSSSSSSTSVLDWNE